MGHTGLDTVTSVNSVDMSLFVWTGTLMGTGFWQCVTALARWTCPRTDPEPVCGVETDSAQKSQCFVHILLLVVGLLAKCGHTMLQWL